MNEHELGSLCKIFLKHRLIKEYFVVASDELKQVSIKKTPCVVIQNTSSRNGSERKHWVVHVVFQINKKKAVHTFDSSGSAHTFTPKVRNYVHLNVNKYTIQAYKPSNICGLYCVWFVFIRLVNTNMRYDFSCLKNKEINDLRVTKFYRKLVLFQDKKDFIRRVTPSAFRVFDCGCWRYMQ